MQLVTNPQVLSDLAQRHHNEFEVLRYQLELFDDISDEQLDSFVDDLAQPIIDEIDCTQCANCCRVLDVYLTPDDAQRLASGIDIPLDRIETHYIDKLAAHEVGEWGKFKQRPCAFLEGKRCSVYTHRPQTCRTYPALTPDFRWTLTDTIQGASICPIIFNTLIVLMDKINELYTE